MKRPMMAAAAPSFTNASMIGASRNSVARMVEFFPVSPTPNKIRLAERIVESCLISGGSAISLSRRSGVDKIAGASRFTHRAESRLANKDEHNSGENSFERPAGLPHTCTTVNELILMEWDMA
jgi:hypothetical protein